MIVQIRTPYNSENCGSFWQAFALCEAVKALGHEVFFLERPVRDTSHGFNALCHKIGHSLVHRHSVRDAISSIKTHVRFSHAVEVLEVSDGKRPYDAVLLGSDTVWQLNSPHFGAHFDRYWAADVDGSETRIVAYAPSIAGSDGGLFEDDARVAAALSDMSAIGVRDGRTQEIIARSAGRSVSLVCDPTLLLDRSCYDEMASGHRDNDYLFAYYFGEPPADLRDAALSYASKAGLRVVSYFGTSLKTADAPSAIDPFEFLSLMGNASVVLTNTYHGTLFSQIFERETVFDSTGRTKVADAVTRLGLERHDYAYVGCADDLFGRAIDHDEVQRKIGELRASSMLFLEKALGHA